MFKKKGFIFWIFKKGFCFCPFQLKTAELDLDISVGQDLLNPMVGPMAHIKTGGSLFTKGFFSARFN